MTKFISKSLLNSYLYCPMQCYLQFIKKVKVEPSEPLIRGIAVHKALELYYDELNVDDAMKDKQNEIHRALFKSEEAQKYKQYMMGIYTWECKRLNHCIKNNKDLDLYFIPKYRELRITSKELELVGYIDRIDRLFNGKLGLFDYKSVNPTKKVLDKLSQSKQEEMMFYYILFTDVHDEEVDLLGILYTHINNSLRTVKITDDLRTRVLNTIDIVRMGIEMGLFPKTEVKYRCTYCDYKDVCNSINQDIGNESICKNIP